MRNLIKARGIARKAILIYGFDAPQRPVLVAIDAFEVLARSRVRRGPRCVTPFANPVHPVHREGSVFAWLAMVGVRDEVGVHV